MLITKNEVQTALDSVGKSIVDSSFDHSQVCQSTNYLFNQPGCVIKGSNISQGIDACALTYTGSKDEVAKHLVDNEAHNSSDIVHKISKASGIPILSGNSLSKNLTSVSSDMVTKINDNVTQRCGSSDNLTNSIICKNSTLNGVYIEQDLAASNLLNCVQDSVNVSSIANHMSNIVNEKAESIVQTTPMANIIKVMIPMLIGIFGSIAFYNISGKITEIKWYKRGAVSVIFLVICLAIALFIWNKSKPTEKEIKDQLIVAQGCSDCSTYTDKNLCEGALCTWGDNKCVCSPIDATHCLNQCYLQKNKTDCDNSFCAWREDIGKCTGDSAYCS